MIQRIQLHTCHSIIEADELYIIDRLSYTAVLKKGHLFRYASELSRPGQSLI